MFLVVFFASLAVAEEKKKSIWDNVSIEKFKKDNPFEPQTPKRAEKKMITKDVKSVSPGTKKPIKNLWDIFKSKKTTKKIPHSISKEKIIPPKLIITGLVWNTDRPQAIINGQVVDIGDTLQATKIVAINKTGVDISFKGKKITITP